MKYTFEPYKEDGSPRKFVGMFRPPLSEDDNFNKIMKTMGTFINIGTIDIDVREKYFRGFLDVPIYEDEDE